MAKRVSIREKRREAPDWIFSWRPLGTPTLPKWLATIVAGMAFVFLITSVRIRVTPPVPWAAHKASVIRVGDDPESQSLVQKAREGGPFPARFDLAEWESSAESGRSVMEALKWTPPAHQPELLDLPKEHIPPVQMASAGKSVFPKHEIKAPDSPPGAALRQVPVLSPLSAGASAWMPRELPAFDGPVTAELADRPWRFLLRLDSGGRVLDTFPLVDLENGKPTPVSWLRRVTFTQETGRPSRWIAVDLSFANQASDGPDAR